jgi:myo-inositol-1(or 4)-monophosphatase
MNYQSFITSVLQEASEIANEKFGKVTSTIKENSNSVVTEADFAIGKHIIERIKKIYPDYNIIDEETGAVDNGSEFTWVIDPIDGTSNFAKSVPTYGIMLGLLHKERPIAGGAALPFFHDICIAEKGKGAYYNNEKISVSSEKKLLNTLVAYGIDSHPENPKNTYEEIKLLSEIILAIRNLRTSNSVFDILLTAKGSYGGVLNRTSKIWDNVAQQIIIEEAEGLYTDFFGKPIDYSHSLTNLSKNFTYCAAPPTLHKELQKIIHNSGVLTPQ